MTAYQREGQNQENTKKDKVPARKKLVNDMKNNGRAFFLNMQTEKNKLNRPICKLLKPDGTITLTDKEKG